MAKLAIEKPDGGYTTVDTGEIESTTGTKSAGILTDGETEITMSSGNVVKANGSAPYVNEKIADAEKEGEEKDEADKA